MSRTTKNATVSLPLTTIEKVKEIANATSRTPHFVMVQAIKDMAEGFFTKKGVKK